MSNRQTQERPGYPVTDVLFPLIEALATKERSQFPSEYPEEFLCAFQTEQVKLSNFLAISDDQLREEILPRVIHVFPDASAQVIRRAAEEKRNGYVEIAQLLKQLHYDANQRVEVRRITLDYKSQPKNYPPIITESGKIYKPGLGGWYALGETLLIEQYSQEGQAIWRIALKSTPWLQRCLMIFIQSDPKKLTQAELDILFAFKLIDRRVVLPQSERDQRIKSKLQ